MKLGRKVRPEIEIQVTSIADMAFLLLIFFVMTTTLTRDMGTEMQIPATAPGESKSKDKTPTILLNGTSIKLVKDSEQEVSIEELRQKLKDEKFADRPPEQRVVIVEGHEDVDYQAFYSVIAAVNTAGGVTTLMTDSGGSGDSGGAGSSGGNGAAAPPAASPGGGEGL